MNTSTNKTALATSVQQVAALVAALDMVAADKSITTVADTHGEKMVTEVLKTLPSQVVAHLLTEVATKQSSLIGNLIAPTTFAAAFEQLPKMWEWDKKKFAMCDVETLITGIVMQLDDDYKHTRAKELYKALNTNHDGAILAWWLMEYTSDVVYFASNRKWHKNLDDFAFKEQISEMNGQLDYTLLSTGNVDDDEPIGDHEKENTEFVVDADEKSEVIYCICPEEIRKCVEKMPRELLEKVVRYLKVWAAKEWSSSKVFTTLLPRVQKSKPIGKAKKAKAQSALGGSAEFD